MKVFCKPGAGQAEVLKAFDSHMSEKHSGKTPKTHSDHVEVPRAGSRQEGNAKHQETERPRSESRKPEVRDRSLQSQSNFLPDSEWDASTQGNVAFHQSPRKIGSDGVAIYERTLYGQGVLETLLKHPGLIRKANPHLQSCCVPTMQIKDQSQPNPQPPKVYAQVIKTHQKKDSAVIVQAPAQNRPTTTGRTDAAAQLSQVLLKRFREIETIAGNQAVLPCCTDAELMEAQSILQSVMARIAKQRGLRGK